MRIYLITLFLIIADFQIKYCCALALDINKLETRANQPDLNATFDGHPEPMDPNFPDLEELAIIMELDGASRLEPKILGPELRQSQDCIDDYSQCPTWASWYDDICKAGWMIKNCKKSCNTCFGSMCEWNLSVVYAQKSLSNTMSKQECKQKCNSENSCQFWTWNKDTRKCGIRDYETDGSLSDAPRQWTGRKNRNEEYEDKVFVSRKVFSYGFISCKEACQNDNQCKAVTWSAYSCALTYGSNLEQLDLPVGSGVASNEKAC